MKKQNTATRTLIAIILFIAAAVTLIPVSSASEVSMLGYKSLCSFAPVSTLFLVGLGALILYYSKKNQAS